MFCSKIVFILFLAIAGASSGAADTCRATDFFAVALPEDPRFPAITATELAYRDIQFTADGARLSADGENWLEFGALRDLSPVGRLEDPTIAEQFFYTYPLDFDLSRRLTPFEDPGRIRNEAFFEMLYSGGRSQVEASLVTVSDPAFPGAVFRVNERRNVACQLRAALGVLAGLDIDFGAFFTDVGGSYNWRKISGTARRSVHSYAIAVDLNAELGGYWKWTGAGEGDVASYRNRMPQELVATMERFGFIWGGKWHHFDGMHFEYRPELILHARIVG